MKVNIGPYPRNLRIPIEDWWLRVRYPDVVFYERVPVTRLDGIISEIDDFINLTLLIPFENKFLDPFFKKRRINITIDPYDVWSLDHTLSLIILPALKELKKAYKGAPFVDDSDVPAELHQPEGFSQSEQHLNGDVDCNWFLRWEWILDEMIWTFTQISSEDNWEMQYHHGTIDIFSDDEDPNTSDYWFDHEGYEKHQDRIKNGLILFGKYYQNLWS